MTVCTAKFCGKCGVPAKLNTLVGLGRNPVWLCIKCFETALRGVRATIDAARSSTQGTEQKP